MFFLCVTLQSCGQEQKHDQQIIEPESNELIASINGFDLTEADFKIYLRYVEKYAGETADIQTQLLIKSELKETFLSQPEMLLQQLQSLTDPDSIINTVVPDLEPKVATTNALQAGLAEGHKIVRQLLGNDIGEMKFDVSAANTFRHYVANTLLTSTTGNYNTGITGTDSRSTNSQTQFCANGTYVESLSGHVSVQVEGAGAVSSGTTYITGYWDVATLPNGMVIIIMYSTHPYVLEDWPNGIIPFVVAKYGEDFMALPSGDLYRRAANHYCN